jgi:hypothetical protein
MSMVSQNLLPSACEVDIAGVVSMYALQLASGRPSALVAWNNNYGDDPEKCVFFHCGNWAKDFLPDVRIGTAPIVGTMAPGRHEWHALRDRSCRRAWHILGWDVTSRLIGCCAKSRRRIPIPWTCIPGLGS